MGKGYFPSDWHGWLGEGPACLATFTPVLPVTLKTVSNPCIGFLYFLETLQLTWVPVLKGICLFCVGEEVCACSNRTLGGSEVR